MIDDMIPEFSDVVPDHGVLDGDKMPMDQIVNIPLVFIGWEISKSKFTKGNEDARRLTLQFELDGRHRVVFTGSEVLIDQIESFEKARPGNGKFKAVIRKIDRFYKFCRTTDG